MAFEHTLETDRLILRAVRESDARSLYLYASDPNIGPACGWAPHESEEASLKIIQDILSAPEQYAITIKDHDPADTTVGCIGIKLGDDADLNPDTDEVELGYWIGRPFWGKGYVPEAARALIRHAFVDLGVHAVWSGYFEGNERSRRVAEKLGMSFQHTRTQLNQGTNETVTANMMLLTRDEWELAQVADPTTSSYVNAQQAEAEALSQKIPRIAYIRTGAQTGADRAGLDAAREAGIPICGWVPPGGLAEDSPEPPGVLANYPELTEDTTDGYVSRTALNVRDSHATLIVAPGGLEPKSGTEMTAHFAKDYGRPCLVVEGIEDIARVRSWLEGLGYGITLNVAGPRESKLPGIYLITKELIGKILADN